MLVGGELDLSPISAFAWAQHADELVLLPDLCIGARDEVVSVVLVSPTPPALLDGVPICVHERIRAAGATCCASSSNAATACSRAISNRIVRSRSRRRASRRC